MSLYSITNAIGPRAEYRMPNFKKQVPQIRMTEYYPQFHPMNLGETPGPGGFRLNRTSLPLIYCEMNKRKGYSFTLFTKQIRQS